MGLRKRRGGSAGKEPPVGAASATADTGPRRAGAVARPAVMPTSVRATVPGVAVVLQPRVTAVEDQTSALVRDLEALGIEGQRQRQGRGRSFSRYRRLTRFSVSPPCSSPHPFAVLCFLSGRELVLPESGRIGCGSLGSREGFRLYRTWFLI